MKIALIYEKFISRGGLENYLYSFAQELVKQSNQLHIITGETDVQTEALPDTEIHLISRRSLGEFATQAEEMLGSLRGKADVSIGFGRTVSHDLHRAGGGCHRFYSEQVLNPLKRRSAKNRLELDLEQQLYTSGKTKHFVVNSQMVSEQLQEAYGVPEESLSIVRTAVDSDRFCPVGADEKQALRARLASGEERRRVFLFVSMNHRRKGLDALLEAWKMSPPENACLWVVGPELSARHRRLVSKLQSSVRTFLNPTEIVDFYQAADFFVHPTLYDACANTVLQSMACGLPGIISERDGARQFVIDGENGTLLPCPTDTELIAEKLAGFARMEEEDRLALGARARETVLPLTWEAHVERWMQVIEQTVQ